MSKSKISLAAIMAAVLIMVALMVPAIASAYYVLSYNRVHNDAREVTREECSKDAHCTAWGVNCRRITYARIDCLEGTWDYSAEHPEEELLCSATAVYRVNPRGYVNVRYGRTHCNWVVAE